MNVLKVIMYLACVVTLFFLIRFVAGHDAPVLADKGDGGAAVEQSDEESWLDELLNPSQLCPHCGQRFSEDRSILMLLIGFVGQIFFTSRFLVQWIASERARKSYVPVAFWYLSIIGSVLLFAYAVSILAWPIIVGQTFGIIVYSRNLALIAFRAKEERVLNAED